MAETRTTFSGASVKDYIASRGSDQQRADCKELITLLGGITRKRPRMWGPSIIGFGSYKYTYASGHSGEAPLAGFAIRGSGLVVYVFAESREQKALLARIGKHKMGKSCLYFKKLSDIDKTVLKQLVTNCTAETRRLYG